ncbi:AraC family transcriptional regulator [Dyadobacter psychrotolerans]|uniref:Helix-turn-helix domain-containing protein n=1 Tax=Dyadobacter psychrotolerans TaxID=2541721 RepID=A0A4R5DC51_9BACT|nr:helix-turn-helix domain-containing protein [Dyadobacter psychrotolerans]TDE09174.1 helix-turn-helix domain-containing protein [Dyadobacter psychrotolerans]
MDIHKIKLPIFCLSMYPSSGENEPFYMIRLEELSKRVKGVDHPHSHSFYMLMIVIKGSGKHFIDLHTYDIHKNQMYLLSPAQVHTWELSEDIEGFVLFFESNFLMTQYPDRLYSYPFFHSQGQSSLIDVSGHPELFLSLFQQAYDEYINYQPQRNQVVLSYFNILLEKANRLYLIQFPDHSGKQEHTLVQRYEQEINRHYLHHKEVMFYADLLGITPNHLNFLCKNVLNKTASQLIYERIGIEAQRLLGHTGATIKEVATALNFEDSSYFNRFFKKQFGISPSEFKQVLW